MFSQHPPRRTERAVHNQLLAALRELESIALDDGDILVVELSSHLADKVGAPLVVVHRCHVNGLAGGEFQGDVARAGEQVQDIHLVEEKVVVKDVEQALFAQVGRWTDGQVGWRHNFLASIQAADDSHVSFNKVTSVYSLSSSASVSLPLCK